MVKKKTIRQNAYIKDKYDRHNLLLPKGFKSTTQEYADKHYGGSLNKTIYEALKKLMEYVEDE